MKNSVSDFCYQHRYYGKSIPFGSWEEAMSNPDTLGYFNSAQALADYAEILLHIKKILNARYSPLIVFGGSYGGSLSLKPPSYCSVNLCYTYKTCANLSKT